jgi:L-threonylcarbamoyladenylate synthase
MITFVAMAEIGTDLQHAKEILQRGDVVAIPTETVYGLAGNALNSAAVARIFEVKKRPAFDPLIIHVPSISRAKEYIIHVPDAAQELTAHFWPGPLTIVLEKKDIIPDLVTSGLNTVGIRCPDHALTRSLLESLEFPLAAPSANPFGYVSPTTAKHVNDQLGERIEYILDGGACEVGIESTIVGFEDNRPVVYRVGGLKIEDIESVIGPVQVQAHSTSNPKAPGQLKSHYAPRKKVIIGKVDDLLQRYPSHTSGILTFTKDFNSPYQFILSQTGSFAEAAQNLFKALRLFDEMPIEVVLAELLPEEGLGRAINDRLRRAAAE